MATGTTILESKDHAARQLAETHRSVDAGITDVYRLVGVAREDDPNEPIKLLEVNRNTTRDGIVPVYFAADPQSGIDYASIIVEIHPLEWERLERHELSLPNGWSIDGPL